MACSLTSAALLLIIVGTTSAEFCHSTLYTDSFVCEDGTTPNSRGCCAATNRCPKTCGSSSWSSRNGVTTCTCTGCNYGRKLRLTEEEQYLKATNYFRCRHGQRALVWDADVARNTEKWSATCPGVGSNPPHTRPDGSNSYDLTPRSGENVARGQGSPEKAVEAWYSEITDPGYAAGAVPPSGTGHYTALIWGSTTKLGCDQNTNCVLNGRQHEVHVCHYAANAPNIWGKYEANVPQQNTPTASEETCCESVYGPPTPGPSPGPSPGPTPGPSPPSDPVGEMFCGFEDSSWCDGMLTQATDDDFDWSTGSGRTPDGGNKQKKTKTGPMSAQSGSRYAFIETSAPLKSYAKATLNSRSVDLKQGAEISLYYLMWGKAKNGKNIGNLRVDLHVRGKSVMLFKKKGNQIRNWNGKKWAQWTYDLSKYAGQTVWFSISATKKQSARGDIAIDSFRVSPGTGQLIESESTVQDPHDLQDGTEKSRKHPRVMRRETGVAVAPDGMVTAH